MKKIIIICTSIVSLFLVQGYVLAETVVDSDITTDTMWVAGNGPYIISNSIAVASGTVLVIGQGTEVKFNRNYITVFGSIQANGSVAKPVMLTSVDNDPANGWGIKVVFSNATSMFTNTNISNTSGIYFQKSHGIFDGVHFKDSITAIESNGSNVDVVNSTFKNLSDNAVILYNSSNAVIADANFDTGLQNAVQVYTSSNVSINNSTITHFSRAGVNGYLNAGISVTESTLSENGDGLYVYNGAHGAIGSSTIEHNINSAVRTQLPITFDARNNWWGDATGPHNSWLNPSGMGGEVSDGVQISPWLLQPRGKSSCCSSILFIPGVEGSRLYEPNLISENLLWEPNGNNSVEKLYLDDRGQPLNKKIYTRDIIDIPYVANLGMKSISIYAKFISFANDLVQNKKINQWLPFPYDWRQDPETVVNMGAITSADGSVNTLLNSLKNLISHSKTGKVTIIGHSNGGLIAKALVKKLQALKKSGDDTLDNIDNVIMVAVPELGSAKAVPSILHGYDQQLLWGTLLSNSVARNLGLNMPDAYTLLPSSGYFATLPQALITFDSAVKAISEVASYAGKTISSQTELARFMTDTKRSNVRNVDTALPSTANSSLLNIASSFHSKYDAWSFPTTTNVYHIAGTGIPTLSTYTYKRKCYISLLCDASSYLDLKPEFSVAGDGVVPTLSSVPKKYTDNNFYLDLQQSNNVNRENRAHADILETTTAQAIVAGIISNKQIVNQSSNEQNQKPVWVFGMHSPADVDVVDEYGNHTGIDQDGVLRQDIPNSSYQEFGEGKYIVVAQDIKPNISIAGTGLGTFTFEMDRHDPVNNKQTLTTFTDIAVTPDTSATLVFAENGTTTLHVDVDGNGVEDSVMTPRITFDALSYIQSLKTLVASLNINQNIKNRYINKLDKIADKIRDNKIKDIEQIIKKIQLSIYTKNKGHHRISDVEKKAIADLIEALIQALGV